MTVVDARGLTCPAPVIRAALAAHDAAPGSVLEVWWTDPAAEHDIPAWARMRGHSVLGTGPCERADADAPAGGRPARSTRIRVGVRPTP